VGTDIAIAGSREEASREWLPAVPASSASSRVEFRSRHLNTYVMSLLRAQLNPLLESILGLALFVSLALTAVFLTKQTHFQTSVPLLFIAIAAFVAFFIGKRAAYIGVLASAIIFAFMLFAPLGSWHVDAQDARVNLAWMIMGGLAAAWIFARQKSPHPPENQRPDDQHQNG
jgi:K+-sensing histidine kinase KdpD